MSTFTAADRFLFENDRTRYRIAQQREPRTTDEFEREFADEVLLPDPQVALDHWNEVKLQLANAKRICAGFDLARGVTAEQSATFSMECRWEAYLCGSKARGTGSPSSSS